jgi:excinuclease ABC subunit A
MPAPYGTDPALASAALVLRHGHCHNLKDLEVRVPLNRFVCLTGVSGSGKTTLLRDLLLPALHRHLQTNLPKSKAPDRTEEPDTEEGSTISPDAEAVPAGGAVAGRSGTVLEGWESLSQVVLVDQSPLGKTPRSNPVVYLGAFEDIRELFAQTSVAQQRGLTASAFSFNSSAGQCERCRGAGFEKIEMQFLSDIFIRCPDCQGRRYREHILEIRLESTGGPGGQSRSWSIADTLDATVEEAVEFLQGFGESPGARRACQRLRTLQEVGLGYLRLGQPINTLSGGESQRLKLASHLSETRLVHSGGTSSTRRRAKSSAHPEVPGQILPTLFLFDEPTTGLHFEDVRILLLAFQRLVEAGHSIVVIEHNLDVIKCADWVIDLGPEAGAGGGRIVVQGPPETVAACAESHTGRYLQEVLPAVAPPPVSGGVKVG